MKYDFKIKGKTTTYHFRIHYFFFTENSYLQDLFAKYVAKKEGKIIVRDIEAINIKSYSKTKEFVFRNLKELLEFRK